jgi:hypothetical protein
MSEIHKAFLLYVTALFGFVRFLRDFGLGNGAVLVALLLVVALTLLYLRRRVVEVRTRYVKVRR